MLNFFRISWFSLVGILNNYRRLPKNTIIVIHGSWIGENSESFLHANTAALLYKKEKDKISYIVVSGYDADPNSLETEGDYMMNVLIKSGVPKDLIITETKALTTTENILRSNSLLESKGINLKDFNIVPIHRPSYIWKVYYLWNMLGYKIYMPIASKEPVSSFLKNISRQQANIKSFLKNPVLNEVETAKYRSNTRTSLNIKPITADSILKSI